MSEGSFVPLLQKMMALHAWDNEQRPSGEGSSPEQRRLVDLILAETEADRLGALEEAMLAETLARTAPEGLNEILYDRLYGSKPLREYLLAEPLLSAGDANLLRIVVRLADVEPNGEPSMMDCSDAMFLRVLERWRREPVTAEKLLLEDLAVLIDLNNQSSEVVSELAELAGNDWQKHLARLERALEELNTADNLPPAIERLLDLIKRMGDPDSRLNVTADLFLSRPRFSAVPGRLVSHFSLLDQVFENEHEALASLDEKSADEMTPVRWEYRYRLEAAKYFLSLRKFAKLDALDHKWPELYRRFNVQRTAVVQYEQYLNDTVGSREEPDPNSVVGRLIDKYNEDEELLRFLRLQPLLTEIFEEERKRFQQIQTTTRPSHIQPEPTGPESKGLDLTSSDKSESTMEKLANGPDPVLLIFQQDEEEDEEFAASLYISENIAVKGPLRVDWNALQMEETRLLVRADSSEPIEKRFRQLGRYLFLQLFDVNMQRALWKALEQGSVTQPQRVLFQIGDPRLHLVPWESLFVNPLDRLIFSSSHFSVLRYVPGKAEMPPVYPESGPLRVLVLLQSPNDWNKFDPAYELGLVRRMMDDATRFEVKVLENATFEAAEIELRGASPQVVHFVGPLGSGLAEDNHHMPFLNEDGTSDFHPLSALADLFWSCGVKVVTLTTAGTPTRTMALDRAMIHTAVGLAEAGIPAVVAPTRMDITSLSFHRTMYGALAAGQTVEAAVLAGRRALRVENQAWIRYALFAGVREPVKVII